MGDIDKIMAPLAGEPVLSYSLASFQQSAHVDEVVLVMSSGNIDDGRRVVDSLAATKVVGVCVGGKRRQDSVREGLARLTNGDIVAVHDAARPFVTEGMIADGVVLATEHGAAIAGVPVKDTIKSVGDDNIVVETLRRDGLWAIQTPQIFRSQLLREAHERVVDDVTDDASMVERLGHPVRVYMGSHENIKVTTPDDLLVAEAILRRRTSSDAV